MNASGQESQPIIFVVDDEAEARASVEFLAKSMRAECKSFASAEEFLKYYQGEPGCLITDVRMPCMTGIAFQDALIERGIELPLLLLTAYPEVGLAVKAMRKGAMTLLEKPCRQSELWDEIQHALDLDRKHRQRKLRLSRTRARLESLSADEQNVLALVLLGTPSKVIAKQLDVSIRTIEARRSSIFRKMEVSSVAELVRAVVEFEESQRPV